MIRHRASTSVDFGMKTVRLVQKQAGRAAPCKQAWKAAKRECAPVPPAERYTLKGRPSGPRADSRFDARSSSDAANLVFQNQIGRRKLTKSKHCFSTVDRDTGAACTEYSAPILAEPACCLIRVENRHEILRAQVAVSGVIHEGNLVVFHCRGSFILTGKCDVTVPVRKAFALTHKKWSVRHANVGTRGSSHRWVSVGAVFFERTELQTERAWTTRKTFDREDHLVTRALQS